MNRYIDPRDYCYYYYYTVISNNLKMSVHDVGKQITQRQQQSFPGSVFGTPFCINTEATFLVNKTLESNRFNNTASSNRRPVRSRSVLSHQQKPPLYVWPLLRFAANMFACPNPGSSVVDPVWFIPDPALNFLSYGSRSRQKFRIQPTVPAVKSEPSVC